MTDNEAAKEAIRRWGKSGVVRKDKLADKIDYVVGEDRLFYMLEISRGDSWEKAFAAIDQRVADLEKKRAAKKAKKR